jgi:hypothetical protein
LRGLCGRHNEAKGPSYELNPRVYDLAELFLSDEVGTINTEDNRRALAQHLQDELENFIAYLRPDVPDAAA